LFAASLGQVLRFMPNNKNRHTIHGRNKKTSKNEPIFPPTANFRRKNPFRADILVETALIFRYLSHF